MNRKWLIVLALFCFLGCVAADAYGDTIDYSGAGSLTNGTAHVSGQVAPGHTWAVLDILVEINDETTGVIQQGNLGTVDVVTGTLTKCAQGLCFVGGDLDIRDMSGTIIFKEAFTSGTVTKIAGNVFVNAVLPQGATVLLEDAKGNFSSDSTITTVAARTPEVGGLMMLGLGCLVLWGVGRNRLADSSWR